MLRQMHMPRVLPIDLLPMEVLHMEVLGRLVMVVSRPNPLSTRPTPHLSTTSSQQMQIARDMEAQLKTERTESVQITVLLTLHWQLLPMVLARTRSPLKLTILHRTVQVQLQ